MVVETGHMQVLKECSKSDLSARLLAAIAASAEDLTNGRGWPDGVHGLLETLGHITGVSRVWIFQTIELTRDQIIQDYTFEWASAPQYVQLGMSSFSMFRILIDNDDYREMIESRKQGEWQKVLTHKLEPSPLRDDMVKQNIKSMLTIPIIVEDQWWGLLGFDDCEREYDWSETEIALLRTATFLISNAIIRDRLSAVRKQFDILQAITESSAWEFNLKKGNFWCTSELINSVPGPSSNVHLSLLGMLKIIHYEDRRDMIVAVREFLQSGEGTFRHDLRIYSQCGEILWVEILGTIGRDASGHPKQFAGIAVDILKRKQREEELLQQATTDHLTGAVNRGMFERKLKESLASATIRSAPVSLLLLDIDHFKQVNDTWGHVAGDMVLREFVSVCGSCLRSNDLIARIGGEEFVILLADADSEMAGVVGERIRRSIEVNVFSGADEDIKVTTSLGCSTYDGVTPTTPEAMFKGADYAVYTAKREGRNRLVVAEADQGSCSTPR